MSLGERIISYQNKAEESFRKQKSFESTSKYAIAFLIFIITNLIAGITFPFRILTQLISKRKKKSEIIDLNDNNIDFILKGKKVILVDFWTDWCGPCLMMNSVLKEFAKNNKAVCVTKVNADSNKKIMEDFGVRGLPQLVLIKDGKEFRRHAGAMTSSQLQQFCFE